MPHLALSRLAPLLAASAAGLLVSACAGAGRLDSFPGFGGGSRVAAAPAPESAPVAIPRTGSVTSEPLPPPSYPGGAPPADPQLAGLPPTIPGAPPPGPSSGAGIPPPVTASPAPASPAPPSSATRLAAVGTWTARDATGSTCRITLSSAASLDLNRAATAGCDNRDLKTVNAWKQEGGEIYLYSAGSVIARVPAGGSTMSGALSRSGAPLTLTR